MNKPIAIALLVAGVVLTVIGVGSTNSFNSDVSRFFTGSPTQKAVWMLVGGIIMGIVGLVGLAAGSRKA
jgi:predicted benzoate:H+ symporter BenE